jgi:hypothetical protein
MVKSPEYYKGWREKRKKEIKEILTTIDSLLQLYKNAAKEYNSILLSDSTIAQISIVENNLKIWRERYERIGRIKTIEGTIS